MTTTAALLAILALLIVGLLLIGVRIATRRRLDHLRDLTMASRRIAAGDYRTEVPQGLPGETDRLASEMGAMQEEIQEREAALHHLAFYDDLTGLPNRNQFRIDLYDHLEAARQVGRRVAVAMVDFDRFKEINDTLGHYLGDRLLAAIAAKLEATAESMDIRVARLGGDEFGLLVQVESINEAKTKVERLRQIVGGALEIEDLRIEIEANIGLTVFPDQGGDGESLLQQAEVAMYVAKEKRLGLTFYETSHNRHSIERLGLMSDLRRAVEDDGLELRFQPKLHLETGAVDQAEVLVRWTHAHLGKISPDEFIPIAEQTGFIREITSWVLRRSLEQVGRWGSQGLEVSAAVNVSAFDLHDRTLATRVQEILEETGVSPRQLVMEITESAVMADLESSQRILDQLEELGVALSIDDFGTGYSSLAQLKRLPVQELKIDRSFISQMTQADDVAQIVRSTIELGHNLGLRVVAEGVESKEAVESLRLMRCDLAQGFFISRPLTADDLGQWRNRMRRARAHG